MKNKTKILIVEDESIIALNLKENLIDLGYEPCGIAPNKCKAMKILENGVVPDLILMDIYLKGPTTGIEFAKELKITKPQIPIIFLTANSEISTIKKASETFAYGYLLKPYKKENLHAAIEIALQKSNEDNQRIKKLDAIENVNKTLTHQLELSSEQKSRTVKLKYGYLYDKEKEILYYGDEPVKLTSKEMKIIKYLCESPGHNVSQEQLEYAIWQDEPAGYAAFRSVLFRLRSKIHKDLISNQNNTGYKIELF
ncbi:response regulator transcription factor [Aliarcobacter cibarius]|uniref:Response regulator transcription factor n=1 Tax=Aliarcobacter cibarius TaxID=255507 RepID=A0ABY2V351_9BACT|nr:response regulator [Aliarcobacter cibarius]TLS97266.1 response regulator transcription factor [Aliarcobacter cibarius]TLS97784.1 response regulator transcription factor [Aliarcobacter cibarius]